MKITCLRENLRNSLASVERVTGKNFTLPILQNILLVAEKGKIHVSATNLEIALRTAIQGKIDREGSVTVPAHTLLGFVNAVPEEKITLEQKEKHLVVRAGRYHAECKGLDPKDFPIIPKVREEFIATIPSKPFARALQALVGLTAAGESKPELSGVYFFFEKEKLTLAATDSFRLGECQVVCKKTSSPEAHEYILPSRAVSEIARIVGETDELTFMSGGNQIAMQSGGREFMSRLIEGKYPNYKAIIPSASSTTMVFEREELAQAVRAAGIFSGKLQDVKLILHPSEKTMYIESRDSEVGEEKIELAGEGDGKDVSISFNYRYLLDAVLNLETQKVLLQCNKETDPVLVKGIGADTTFFLIMPLRSF